MPTSFGPEESEAVVMKHRLIEQRKKQEQRKGLTNQIEVSLSNYRTLGIELRLTRSSTSSIILQKS